jgi:hypothetical protein
MGKDILNKNAIFAGMYVQSIVTSWIYLVCEDGDNLIPTHRVEDNDIVEHYVNAKYSMSEDGIGVCETIFTKKLNKHIFRDKILNELGI